LLPPFLKGGKAKDGGVRKSSLHDAEFSDLGCRCTGFLDKISVHFFVRHHGTVKKRKVFG
jgi:hypothetical protein